MGHYNSGLGTRDKGCRKRGLKMQINYAIIQQFLNHFDVSYLIKCKGNDCAIHGFWHQISISTSCFIEYMYMQQSESVSTLGFYKYSLHVHG